MAACSFPTGHSGQRSQQQVESPEMKFTRREALKIGAGTGASMLLGRSPLRAQVAELITKQITSSGERVPVVGLAARNYRVGEGWAPDTAEFRRTLQTFHDLGGRILDTSPN